MKKVVVLILGMGFWLSLGLTRILAATGIITGSSAYAWGENMGWINFLAVGSGITITDTGLTGYAWNSNYGWINLSPSNGGVTNNCSGELGGVAWSSTLGWIDFTGIKINSSGKFTGTIGTAGTSIGRITFDCSNCDVETDWRPSCVSTPTPAPTSTTTSVSNTAGPGWSPPSCTATKPSNAPIITSVINNENNNVILTWSKAKDPVTHYLVAYGTKSGSIEYGNPNVGNSDTTNYTVKGLSGGTKYYFKIKAINDCMPGDWSNEVNVTSTGNVFTGVATGFIPIENIETSQLFDIALIVDEPKVEKLTDLKAKVTFISFGNKDTPVQMNFKIIDENGKEYYDSNENTTIQTEGVFNKSFEGVNLAKGKYTLMLTTVYNSNIKDEFKQEIEISENVKTDNKSSILVIISGLILIVVIWIISLIRKGRVKR